ncbi:MAG: glycosyltransferase [Candidatus Hydrogenedentes bacterium]|nr:glycosyltransferase [Candidatus Hydrogenedentota bacterium]
MATGEAEGTSGDAFGLVVLTPVYQDWEACGILLQKLDEVLAEHELRARVLIVDDGSTVDAPETFARETYRQYDAVDIVHLRTNLGHQRAIGVGLTYAYEEVPLDAVAIMDSDGEDRPEDVPRLVARFRELNRRQVVFADRTRRSESIVFKIFYLLYKIIVWTLTSTRVRVGNFSVLSAEHLSRLVAVSDLWNHYAAAVFNANIPHTSVPTSRGVRYAGRSAMNFVALVTHGLSSIAVFSGVVGVRLLLACAALLALFFAGIVVVLALQASALVVVPQWAMVGVGILGVLLAQLLLLSFGAIVFILHGRDRMSFLPIRDYHYFVARVTRRYPHDE